MEGAEEALGGRGRLAGLEADRAEVAPEHLPAAVAAELAAAGADPDLPGIGEIEGDLRRGGVALVRVRLEAVQDHLLQPLRDGLHDRARRDGVAPEPLSQRGEAPRAAEGILPGGELVEHRAEREDVAPRVPADAHHLLRRDVRAPSRWGCGYSSASRSG